MASDFETKIFVFVLEYIITIIKIIVRSDQQKSAMLLQQGHFLRTKSQAKQFYCKEQRYLNDSRIDVSIKESLVLLLLLR